MSIIRTDQMTAMLRQTADNIQPNELCIGWHRNLQHPGWGDKKSCEDNMRNWRKAKRQNKLYINPKESREVKINGEPWHILIVQEGTPEDTRRIGFDPFGFGIDDMTILVDGMIYFFKNKANRDMIVDYVMK